MRIKAAHALSFAVGFLSLSQEILWFRLVGFSFQGMPQAFAFTLGCFLMGVAAGAALGRRCCEGPSSLFDVAGKLMLTSAAADVALPALVAVAFRTYVADGAGFVSGAVVVAFTGVALGVTAGLKGAVFPLAHHLGTAQGDRKLASSVSRTYFANIAGSALAPLITGFVLLDWLSLQQTFVLVALGSFAVALACLRAGRLQVNRPTGIAAVAVLSVVLWAGVLPKHMLIDFVAVRPGKDVDAPLRWVTENRHGVIHTVDTETGDEVVFGGNVYDGRINTSLLLNTNGIHRAYNMAVLHPGPKRVLVVGMSGGSWLNVLLGVPGVESVDVVEINPGFVELVAQRSEVAQALADPRVKLHVDDGRRWVKALQGAGRFDLVLMNTTFHWRSYLTNLLSVEFLVELRRHLEPGGVVYYNATGSHNALAAAAQVFPNVYNYSNFIAASDVDLSERRIELAHRLWRTQALGRPRFDLDNEQDRAALRRVFSEPLREASETLRQVSERVEPVTDGNMLSEYRHGRSLLPLRQH